MPDLANESAPTLAPCIYRYRYGHGYGRQRYDTISETGYKYAIPSTMHYLHLVVNSFYLKLCN